jgi:4-hydroxybutyryl-CoA dehydratase/vinylacetyl-CoA-Delta-isomerase
MAIKTPREYVESLKDGRIIYADGEEIRDVAKNNHRALKAGLKFTTFEYEVCANPEFRSLLVTEDEKGEPYHFVLKPPTSAQDLLRRRSIVQRLARMCCGMPGGAHWVGIDALHAVTAIGRQMDKQLGTSYGPRVEAFREECKKKDLGLCGGMTDVKGDRSLRPSAQKAHKDFYVRIVDESKTGITVRGALAHITFAPYTNEIIVLPCRAMREDDKDSAVAFAAPLNSKGLSLILPRPELAEDGNYFDYPITARVYGADAMIIFDDVFIPMERVFMKREWRFAGPAAYMFGNFHRLSGDGRKIVDLENLVGSALLMSEYNGLSKYGHIQDKLSELIYYAESAEALGRAAALDCVTDPDTGFLYPNPMISNLAKYTFANNWHWALKTAQDIAGGLSVTMPSSKDYHNPKLKPIFDKYLQAKEGVPAEERIRVLNLIRDMSLPVEAVGTIHGEGSLMAQRLSFLATVDRKRYESAAKRAAGVKEDKPHTAYSGLPPLSAIDNILESI